MKKLASPAARRRNPSRSRPAHDPERRPTGKGAAESDLRHACGGPRQRDVFPLKWQAGDKFNGASFVGSRSVGRRLLQRERVDDMVGEVVVALNEMACFPRDGALGHSSALPRPAVHEAGVSHVLNTVQSWGKPPVDLKGREAFRELQAGHSYVGAALHVAPMDISLLSLGGAGCPVPLQELLQEGTQ